MKQIPRQLKTGEAVNLGALELKANLNDVQREHLQVLKDKMKKILRGKTKQELAKAGDLKALKKYKSVLENILEFLRTKEIVLDAELRKEWQIAKVEAIIKSMGDIDKMSEEQKWRLERLKDQLASIKEPDEDKYDMGYDDTVELFPVTQFTVDEVKGFICKLSNLKEDDVFLYNVYENVRENNKIESIHFGLVGEIAYVYDYYVAHRLNFDGEIHPSGLGPDTIITKTEVDLKSGDHFGYDVSAKWSEERRKWEDDDGNEIEV